MKNQATRPQPWQTLRNVPVFVSADVVSLFISFASVELADALLERCATSAIIIIKSLVTRTSSSNPTLYGDCYLKVGKNSYPLVARYDEDRCEWLLIF